MLAGITNLRRLDQVEHFWDTVDTIGEGFGFSLFGARHLVTLALYIGFAALSCKLYKAADEKKRAQLRGLFAVLLLADEAFKQIGLQIGGNFNWDYLPLHLCSINIFLIALYAWKPSRLLDNFLYFKRDRNFQELKICGHGTIRALVNNRKTRTAWLIQRTVLVFLDGRRPF